MEQKNSQNIKTKHGSLTESRQRLFGPLWWWAVIKISSSSLLWDMSISVQDKTLQSVRGDSETFGFLFLPLFFSGPGP